MTLAVFAQTFGFKFLNFDDNLFVSENPRLAQGLSVDGVKWAFTANLLTHDRNAEYWEPFTLLSRLADVEFNGRDAGAHHRTNVLLHLAAGLILFAAMRALLRSDWRAGLIAALFLIHPLHVEAVAWLSARKDILNGLFFFATIWAYAWYVVRPGAVRLFIVGVVFLFANMSKPMGVSLPLILLLLDFWPLGRFRSPVNIRTAVRLCVEKLPMILIALVVAILAVIDQHWHGAIGDETLYPSSVRLGNAAISYCAYLIQTFVPVNLAIFYPHPGNDINWLLAAASAVCLFLITLFCILNGKRRPWLLVGWLWFVIVLLPVCGIVQIGEMARADRYTYISLVGIFLLCVEQGSEWLGQWPINWSRWRTAAVGSLVFLGCGLLSFLSWKQTQTWYDSVSVFQQALAVTNDNYLAEANLASALFEAGRKEEGRDHYREAIRLHQPALEYHRRVAREAENRHQLAAAIHHYSKVLTYVPSDTEVHQRLGAVLLENGDYGKALVQYNEVLRYDRNAIPPRLGVARVLIAQRRFDEARGLLNAILRMNAENEEASALLRTLPPGSSSN
jgi:tetratricopeptide (TPR) repeat protein